MGTATSVLIIVASIWALFSGMSSQPQRVEAPAASPTKEIPKINSPLSDLVTVFERGNRAAAADLALTRGVKLNGDRVQVVVEAAGEDPSAAAADAVADGGKIEATYNNLIKVDMPVSGLRDLSDKPSVSLIRQPRKPLMNAVTSEGVADINASTWQASGVRGAGVKIAVIDPGFAGYQGLIASGELPSNTVAVSFSGDITGGGINHGSACAEIVHDVAPQAQIFLLNFADDVDLGNAVNYVKGQGISVVSSSWVFPEAFPGDGSGAINDMVTDLNNQGIFWSNSAGNSAQNHWSGGFSDLNANDFMNFSTIPNDEGNDIMASAGETISGFLTWDDWAARDQDYDLFLYYGSTASGTPVATSENPQTGTQEPSEALSYPVPAGQDGIYSLAIKKISATGNANFQLFGYNGPLQYQVPASSIAGQPADSPYALTNGAVQQGTNTLESFSSQGPTLDSRIKPDITAPDGVSTATAGTQNFYGTSASSPHAAGAAALLKFANPGWVASDLRNSMKSTATDLGDPGEDNLFGSGKLHMGAPPVPSNYLFTWYDEASPGMRDWLLMANATNPNHISPNVQIAASFKGYFSLGPGGIITPEFPGTLNGPVQTLSPAGFPMLTSQRIIYNGNFTETPAMPKGSLANDYYLTWYDEVSAGIRSWIMISNQGTAATTAQVFIHGVLRGSFSLAPGARVIPEFPGIINGPVLVHSTAAQPLLVSERTTYNGSFSEALGIPAATLANDYLFTWYDFKSPGLRTWVLMANPSGSAVSAQVFIAGSLKGTFNVPANGVITPVFPGIIGGPVRVRSTGGQPLIVSERSTYSNSFEEVQGASVSTLPSTSWFTWYDQVSTGLKTWVLMSNPGASATSADIYVGWRHFGPYNLPAGGGVQAINLPGIIGGPVKVAAGQPILASERTIYNASFNEITGVTP